MSLINPPKKGDKVITSAYVEEVYQNGVEIYLYGGLRGRKTLSVGMDSPLTESLNTPFPNTLLMAVTDGASVTETPERGSMWYASTPFNSPIRGHHGFASLGVGATLSACGALPSTLWARWGFEAGSPVRKGGVVHIPSSRV